MKTIRNNLFPVCMLLTMCLVSCEVDIIQPIALEELRLQAGSIREGEWRTEVTHFSPEDVHPLSNFGLEITISEWEETGEDVESPNTWVSTNAIAEILITSDSIIMVTADSVYIPGEDLSALFKTDRTGRRRFEPRFSVDYLIGRNISFDRIILQLSSTLDRDLHQTFIINLIMDDGQTFSLQSNMVRVSRE